MGLRVGIHAHAWQPVIFPPCLPATQVTIRDFSLGVLADSLGEGDRESCLGPVGGRLVKSLFGQIPGSG